ncbi:MAG: hypothetical protein Q9225_006049 [Loekoesia sp. 1 TL-2023]
MSSAPDSTEQWVERALQRSSWQRSEEQTAIRIICALLKTQITPQEAAARIASTYEASVKRGDPGLWFLWTAYFDAINHLGFSLDNLTRLAQTARCISRLPDILDDNGNPIMDKTRSQVYWRHVPLFAYYFSEAAIDHPFLEDLDKGRGLNRARVIQKLLNGNVFAALYLRELDPDGPKYDFWFMRRLSRDHLMFALEVATDTHHQIRHVEVYLPPAAMWIMITGRNIYKYCKGNLDNTGEPVYQRWIGGTHGSELTWTDQDGFNVARWNFWQLRFKQISVLPGIDRVVSEYASKAMQEMRTIESELETK